jgi:hypothetical protein
MPDQDRPLPEPGPARRGVLRGAAGLGAAGLAAGLLTVTKAGAAEADTPGTAAAHDEPLVVHVHDARTGVVDLYTGTRHVRITDRNLAAQLAHAAR